IATWHGRLVRESGITVELADETSAPPKDFHFSASISAAWLSMGKRREARERAVQFLFQHDLNPPPDLDSALEQFWETQRAAAIAEDKGAATWGQPVALPPPTTEEAAVRLFADPLI